MRYLPHTPDDIAEMLATIGVEKIEDLFRPIPEKVRRTGELDLPEALSEWELTELIGGLSRRMARDYQVYLGAGSYEHFIPESIRYLSARSEFTTAYTPYQPEVSQGTLQAIFEYQTLISRLLGLEVANASMYDGASALAEALLMALRLSKKGNKVAVSRSIHPAYRRVASTYLAPTGHELVELPYGPDGTTDYAALNGHAGLAALAVQSPNFFGRIEDISAAAEAAHRLGALLIVTFSEPLAYGLFKNPGLLGADIACGEGQSFGLAQAYGGPGLGILATKMEFVRNIPGRLVGQTVDMDGRRGFVLTLAAREQHIRREKAVSNICTNSSHSALTAAMYLASIGGPGLRQLARLNYDQAEYLKGALRKVGGTITFEGPTFNEFVVKFPDSFDSDRLLAKKIVPGLPLAAYYPELAGHYLLCVTETKNRRDMDALVKEVKS